MSLATNNLPIQCTTSAQLHVSDDGSVRSDRFDDIYFNPINGADESRQVFIEGNNLIERWKAWLNSSSIATFPNRDNFVVIETGFGTGLNFLSAIHALYSLADQLTKNAVSLVDRKPRNLTLYYYSTEKYPLTPKALGKVYARYNPFPALSDELIRSYPDPLAANFLITFNQKVFEALGISIDIKLILLFGDNEYGLDQLECYPQLPHTNDDDDDTDSENVHRLNAFNGNIKVDAWFLDGFSPAVNPEMWTNPSFEKIANLSHIDTTLATFSVAKSVKQPLIDNGFEIIKKKGFGTKRERLTARYTGTTKPIDRSIKQKQYRKSRKNIEALSACYYRYPSDYAGATTHQQNTASLNASDKPHADSKTAIVIGAGIAGACIAWQLSRLDWRVTVVNSGETIAAAASGNDVGVLYARTSAQRSHLSEFHEAAFHYARHFYERRVAINSVKKGAQDSSIRFDGMLKLGDKLESGFTDQYPEISSRRNVDNQQARELSGIAVKGDGIFYAHAGAFSPRAICKSLLEDENITVVSNTEIKSLKKDNAIWTAKTQQGDTFAASEMVIACGEKSDSFEQTRWLPTKAIRGQTTLLSDSNITQQFSTLNHPVCGNGYIAPPHLDTSVTIGATFNLHDDNKNVTDRDHVLNIHNLLSILDPQSDEYKTMSALVDQGRKSPKLDGRVGFRAVTPDYLPIVGSLVDAELFMDCYSSLRKNAKQQPFTSAPLLDGLNVFTGLGSHGFTYAPLASEILAAQINRSPLPVAEALRKSIAPQRFLIRNLIRGVI